MSDCGRRSRRHAPLVEADAPPVVPTPFEEWFSHGRELWRAAMADGSASSFTRWVESASLDDVRTVLCYAAFTTQLHRLEPESFRRWLFRDVEKVMTYG